MSRLVLVQLDPARTSGQAGKFVHLRSPDGEILATAPYGHAEYHAEIVAALLERLGVEAFVLGAGRDACEVYEPGWRILGGGHYRMDPSTGVLWLGGRSRVYGPCDLEGLSVRSGEIGLEVRPLRIAGREPPVENR